MRLLILVQIFFNLLISGEIKQVLYYLSTLLDRFLAFCNCCILGDRRVTNARAKLKELMKM